MKFPSRKALAKYLYDQLTGNFTGFLIGLSATTLVSQFFETRSIKNFWGLTSRKTVVDKETFSNLEWIISIVIGFVVFEIMTKVVKEKIDKHFPAWKYKIFRWLVTNNWHVRFKTYSVNLNNRRLMLFATMHSTIKNTFIRYSKR